MQIVYTTESIPNEIVHSIFLAGPTLRSAQIGNGLQSWRVKALAILELLNYNGIVFLPEPNPNNNQSFEQLDYETVHQWETKCLNIADRIIFWINRDLDAGILGLTTNTEFGQWMESGKCILGTEPGADSVRYQEVWAKELKIPTVHNLYELIKQSIKLDQPAVRTDGERHVPLMIWNTRQFQDWYADLKRAGNQLQSGKVLKTFQASNGFIFAYVLWVNVYIQSEGRHKNNEFIVSRTDTSSCVLYYPRLDPMRTEVVVVSEFRSPVSNKKGLVYELPGGSAPKSDQDPIITIIEEVEEETGFKMDPNRIVSISKQQVCATLLTHKTNLYSYQLNSNELDLFYQKRGLIFGKEEDTERTSVHVYRLGNILDSELVDWSTIGMIMKAVQH